MRVKFHNQRSRDIRSAICHQLKLKNFNDRYMIHNVWPKSDK
jgi:hypothetical protein